MCLNFSQTNHTIDHFCRSPVFLNQVPMKCRFCLNFTSKTFLNHKTDLSQRKTKSKKIMDACKQIFKICSSSKIKKKNTFQVLNILEVGVQCTFSTNLLLKYRSKKCLDWQSRRTHWSFFCNLVFFSFSIFSIFSLFSLSLSLCLSIYLHSNLVIMNSSGPAIFIYFRGCYYRVDLPWKSIR